MSSIYFETSLRRISSQLDGCDLLRLYSLKVSDVYEAYNNIPSIKAKDDFLMSITSDVNRQDFTTKSAEGKKKSF